MLRIETERLVLRNFLEKDAEGLLAYLAAPRANCFLREKITGKEEALADIRRRRQAAEGMHLAVCLKENDAIIGNLFAERNRRDTCGVGWNFNEKYQGKGYAYEAAIGYFNFLFYTLNIRRIYAYVEEDNRRSQRLCERIGMRNEARFLEFVSFTQYADGTPKYENTLVYALLKKEWEKRSM